MPRVTAMNLRVEDPLRKIEEAVRTAMTIDPAPEIDGDEVDFVPVYEARAYRAKIVRIDIDLWEGPTRTKEALQDMATRVAQAFQSLVGEERRVKVVIRPYDVSKSGWVSL